MTTRVPPFRYSFRPDDIRFITDEISELLHTHGHLTMGSHGEKLEAEFAQYNNVSHAVATSSGTAALEIILRSVDVAGGDVIVPTNTFGATAVAVIRAAATPVLADAGADLSIDVDDVSNKLSGRVRAVVTVHIGGLISAGTPALAELCRSHGIALVEDAAHAAGATLNGRKAGSFGVAAAFSLFSTKVMTSGEGGLITTDDNSIYETAMLLRDHAKNPDGTMSTLGYNWRLTEMQAIVARCQLRRLDEMIQARNHVAARYDQALEGLPGLTVIHPPGSSIHNRYKYVAVLDRHDPNEIQKRLAAEFGVDLGGYVYQTPLHGQSAFEAYATTPLPKADRLCASHICPPIYPDMTDSEVDRVSHALRLCLA